MRQAVVGHVARGRVVRRAALDVRQERADDRSVGGNEAVGGVVGEDRQKSRVHTTVEAAVRFPIRPGDVKIVDVEQAAGEVRMLLGYAGQGRPLKGTDIHLDQLGHDDLLQADPLATGEGTPERARNQDVDAHLTVQAVGDPRRLAVPQDVHEDVGHAARAASCCPSVRGGPSGASSHPPSDRGGPDAPASATIAPDREVKVSQHPVRGQRS